MLPSASVLEVTEEETSDHRLLRQPGCPYCSPAQHTTTSLPDAKRAIEHDFEYEWTRPDDGEPPPARRAAFLDRKLGPLAIEEYSAPGLFRGLPLVLGSLRMMVREETSLRRRERFSVTFGSGMNEARRRLVAYAEGIERYAGAMELPDLVGLPYDELRPFAIAPDATIRFLPEQYRDRGGTQWRYQGEAVDWSWVYDWTEDQARLLIHDAVAMNTRHGESHFRIVDEPFSSGFAAHRTVALALRRALFELIERDALMLAWYLRLPLSPLDTAGAGGPEFRGVLEYLQAGGVALEFFDLRVDFDVPTVLLVARATKDLGPWREGGHIISTAAAPSWGSALEHVVQEILGHFSVFAHIAPDGAREVDPVTGERRAWWPAFAAFLSPRDDAPFAFLREREVSRPPRVDLSLGELKRLFQERGLPVLVRRLGQEDVRDSGLSAVRAFVPGLLRATPSRTSVNFGEPRIDDIRRRWSASKPLNPMTHPVS
jgi:thiazole/oxazole-forming peptide maturase SagD family component